MFILSLILREKKLFDAMKIENRRDNECWLNALTDYYGDTVLGSNRREVLSRDRLLKMIGKTEENVKDGCSLPDVIPFSISLEFLSVYTVIRLNVFSNMTLKLETLIFECSTR